MRRVITVHYTPCYAHQFSLGVIQEISINPSNWRIIRPSFPCLKPARSCISRVIREMKKKKEEREDKVGSGWSFSFRWNRIFSRSTATVTYLEAMRGLTWRAILCATSLVLSHRTNTCQTFRTRQIVVIFLQQRGDDFFQSLARLFYSSRVRFGNTPVLFSLPPVWLRETLP